MLATLAVAVVGVALTLRVVHTEKTHPDQQKEHLMDMALQVAGWALLLLSMAVGLRRRALADTRKEDR
ncbi:hypothetical protein [Sphaerisporangium sp. TRM90804]|uniref:hypothetical protein n=1 Tax=Sphaerisporangium sp. TRM90804 TaxID=3031113 RepID=UPI002448A261|nr:hypothetical protein [Sphaerisporangium sp. TRM90804]MDH2424822.1 hypothetical protein [Sphaerisporangium sp. TRM90804]